MHLLLKENSWSRICLPYEKQSRVTFNDLILPQQAWQNQQKPRAPNCELHWHAQNQIRKKYRKKKRNSIVLQEDNYRLSNDLHVNNSI